LPITPYGVEVLLLGSALAVAIAAVDRSAFAGLKGHFRFLAAFGADYRVHLALSEAAGSAVAVSLPCLSAGRASLGLVGVAFGLEELLLRGAEGKGSTAIGALELLILKTQRMTSFLLLVG
jgi:hypothetical protein